ncbi:MAG TPA: DUF3368 domain-containing protein [Anaerolineae bacterium]|nr:DUF3368 domain-containing protein [Anaerolineae bacterium]
MADAISNTSPLLYLFRIGKIHLLLHHFENIITTPGVKEELRQGEALGYHVPNLDQFPWITIRQPKHAPSEWVARDLGRGELEVISLALEMKHAVVLLDDALARNIAQAAGLTVWGTLRVLLESKRLGYIENMASVVDELKSSGMWISNDIRYRILRLAEEA